MGDGILKINPYDSSYGGCGLRELWLEVILVVMNMAFSVVIKHQLLFHKYKHWPDHLLSAGFAGVMISVLFLAVCLCRKAV